MLIAQILTAIAARFPAGDVELQRNESSYEHRSYRSEPEILNGTWLLPAITGKNS